MTLRIEPDAEPIPGYRLLERLGAGGFGEVWKAEAPGGLIKAIKIVRDDTETGGLAQQELKSLRRVQTVRHPYLLSIDRYDVIDGNLLIVTELADCNLSDRWRTCHQAGQPGIPRAELLRYLSEAAEVLDLMRVRHHLQHLDIKPQNLFLIHDHVKVADFGLVKDLQGLQTLVTGAVTPFYAAPETFDKVISRHCDQYSLAIVYQELLTGHRPFTGGSAQQIMAQHLQAAPNLSPLSPEDRSSVARALAKAPDERFASCSEFIRALLRSNSDPTTDVNGESISPDRGEADSEQVAPAINEPASDQRDQTGDGTSALVVVIGLGGVGGLVVRRLRQALSGDDLSPRIRCLFVDTDAEALAEAAAAELLADGLLHIPLKPPSYYRKPARDRTSIIEGWLDFALLERLAQQPTTQGIRALGRLALVDHAGKVEQVFASRFATKPGGKTQDAPIEPLRVYLTTGLAGGTGSGILCDTAYLVRRVLDRIGLETAEVHAWVLAPFPQRRTPTEVRATANTCAALIELHHFSLPNTTYEPRGIANAEHQESAAQPFDSTTVIPLGPSATDGIELAVSELLCELHGTSGDPSPSNRLTCCTLGAVRTTWPGASILERAAVRTGGSIVDRWCRSNADSRRQTMETWAVQHWASLELRPEQVMQRMQAECSTVLGRASDDLIGGLSSSPAAHFDLVADAESLVGRPGDEMRSATGGRLGDTLLAAFRRLAPEWVAQASSAALSLLEQPDFRLAGAELAAQFFSDRAGEFARETAPLAEDCLNRSTQVRSRLDELLAGGSSQAADFAEAISSYARWRFQGMVFGRITATYNLIRAQMAHVLEQLRACRTQLELTLQDLRRRDLAASAVESPGLLSPSNKSIVEAADRAIAQLSWDDGQALERRVQEAIAARWGGLGKALQAADAPQQLGDVLRDTCRAFLAPRIDESDATDIWCAPDRAVADIWEAARPPLATSDAQLQNLLEVPPGFAGARFAALVRDRMDQNLKIMTGPPGTVAVIRKASNVPLSDLPQVGDEARAAYALVCRADGIAPHARFDLSEWSLLEGAGAKN